MSYKKIDSHIISEFLSFLDEKQVIASENEKLAYAQDKTEDFVYMPELVLIPDNAEDISKILKICNEHIIPVTVRSTGTGLSGGALPVKGGIVISMEKFDKILNIDTDNFQITTEPFVINYILQQAVKEKGLFYVWEGIKCFYKQFAVF